MSYKLVHTFAALPKTTRAKRLSIKGDPKGEKMLYGHSKGVVIRSVKDPKECTVLTEHKTDVLTAAYSPSGFYILSGDNKGSVQLWDTVENKQVSHKIEFTGLQQINDIAWDMDSKKCALGGNGPGGKVKVVEWKTGRHDNIEGGPAKSTNTVDMKKSRPFRLVTASEDHSACMFKGPPFRKPDKVNKEHTTFVNVVRFSPNGDKYVTGSSDKKIFLYDSAEGELIKEIGSPAHAGGVYDIAWCQDSKHILTASADKTAKIFNVDDNVCTMTFTFKGGIEHQQLACAWIGDELITVELSGHINYLDRENPGQPKRVLKGHNKNICSLAVSADKTKIYTGGSDGKMCVWNPTTGDCETVSGQPHGNQVTKLVVEGNNLYSISMDDSFRVTSTEKDEYSDDSVSFDAEPKSLSAGKDGLVVVSCINQMVYVIRNGKTLSSKKFDCEVHAVAVHPNQTEVAVGHATEPRVFIYSLEKDTINELKTTLEITHPSSVMEYSADGAYLAVGQMNKNLSIFSTPDWNQSRYTSHTSRISCLKWAPDSIHLATGSYDSNAIVWDASTTNKVAVLTAAHKFNILQGVDWLSNNRLVTTAHDCSVKIWDISY